MQAQTWGGASGIALLCAGMIGTACVIGRYEEGDAIPWERVEAIQPGVTTKAEILSWFGAPRNFVDGTALDEFLEDQELLPESPIRPTAADVFAYQRGRGRLEGLTLIFYNRFDLRIDAELLVVFFDEDDRVSYVGVRRRAIDAD